MFRGVLEVHRPGAIGFQLGDGESELSQALAVVRGGMVEEQIRRRGVKDDRVLRAMLSVPRHLFVPPELVPSAYEDRPLPIGNGQTISQPYIVAYMTEKLALKPGARVLDIGTGSGYHAAVLSRVAAHVYSVEVVPELASRAASRLARLGFDNVHLRIGDGAAGWAQEAPFDGVLVACGAPAIPAELVRELAPGGRLIMPVGSRRESQDLVVVEKDASGRTVEWSTIEVRFVPLVGPGGESAYPGEE